MLSTRQDTVIDGDAHIQTDTGGQPQTVELELPGGETEVADLVDGGAGHPVREGAALLLDQEQLQAVRGPVVLTRRTGAGEQVEEVRGQRVTDPPLRAGDHPPGRLS